MVLLRQGQHPVHPGQQKYPQKDTLPKNQDRICHRDMQGLQLKLLLIHHKIQGLKKVHGNPVGRSDLVPLNQSVS